MRKSIETERLILRELLPTDIDGMFELDSNPEVHIYLGNKPVTHIEQSREYIKNIRQQYLDNGIGRWAVILKETNEFVGWSGLKLNKDLLNKHQNFYEIGYRFIQKHWGKGYGTESSKAFIEYGFKEMKIDTIYGYADSGNLSSRKILEKIGLQYVNTFEYEGEEEVWYEMKNPY